MTARSAHASSATASKPRILDDAMLTQLAREHGTPLFVYDADVVRRRIRELGGSGGFDVVRYAQKANANLALLRLMRAERAQVDAVSAGEVARALAAGFAPREIAFTADLFDRAALRMLEEQPVCVNMGSPNMLAQYARVLETSAKADREHRARITLRVNPGFGHGHDRKVNTGGEMSKHGIWHEDLPAAAKEAQRLGLRVHGLHVHIGSGSDLENLTRVCDALARLAPIVGESLDTMSAGGGLPIPYRVGEARMDVARFTNAWREARAAMESELGRKLALEVEPGRYLVAECGVLLTEVRGTKRSGSVDYMLVDAGFHNLIRPALYGAHHHISVVGRRADEPATPKIVAGPLCESADVFTQNRAGELVPQSLPDVREGELVCIHDAGAYASSMASNYNTQPFAAEVLVDGGQATLVRRRETIDEMLASEREELRAASTSKRPSTSA
jgi:diaminopimelate decarboxylase